MREDVPRNLSSLLTALFTIVFSPEAKQKKGDESCSFSLNPNKRGCKNPVNLSSLHKLTPKQQMAPCLGATWTFSQDAWWSALFVAVDVAPRRLSKEDGRCRRKVQFSKKERRGEFEEPFLVALFLFGFLFFVDLIFSKTILGV